VWVAVAVVQLDFFRADIETGPPKFKNAGAGLKNADGSKFLRVHGPTAQRF